MKDSQGRRPAASTMEDTVHVQLDGLEATLREIEHLVARQGRTAKTFNLRGQFSDERTDLEQAEKIYDTFNTFDRALQDLKEVVAEAAKKGFAPSPRFSIADLLLALLRLESSLPLLEIKFLLRTLERFIKRQL